MKSRCSEKKQYFPKRRQKDPIEVFWCGNLTTKRGERGFYCSIFRNESGRLSSEVILECERIAVLTWGQSRAFTYITPSEISSCNPGFCFKCAGWKFVRENSDGKHVLEKLTLETPIDALSLGHASGDLRPGFDRG